jgi:hypothetical protein
MSDVMPTGEEEHEELDAPAPEALASELGLELSADEAAEAEQMVARLKSQFGLEQEAQEGDEPESSELVDEEPEAAEEEPAEPGPLTGAEEWISIDGRAIPVAEARSMLELRQYLAANPDKAEKVRAAIEAEPAAKPEPEPEPPEFLDLEDPSQRFMWEQFKAQHQQIAHLQQAQAAVQADSARARALGDVQGAMSTFRQNHPELTEDDVTAVRTHAVALNIIDGLAKTRTGPEAVLKALDIAYMDHPEFRAKATATPSPKETKAAENKSRRQKLSGLAGSSVSATREPEAPKRPETDREMRQQAAKWASEQGLL